MYLIVYGPEGSGKGSQAKLLSDKFGIPVYTAGDLVREEATKDKGKIGEMARKVLLEGKYLPDKEICYLLEKKLLHEDSKKGFILDGFPRTLAQANFLMDIFSKNGYSLNKVIYLKLSNDVSIKRLIKRKRKVFGESNILHDTPERIKQRLIIYQKDEVGLLKFFKEKNLLLEIDANQTIEKVFKDTLQGLTPLTNLL